MPEGDPFAPLFGTQDCACRRSITCEARTVPGLEVDQDRVSGYDRGLNRRFDQVFEETERLR